MLSLKKAAKLIKHDGLFTFIYNEMKEVAKRAELTEEEIVSLLKKHPNFLDDYKELNTQSEISNIQIKEQAIFSEDSSRCQELKATINQNIPKLIALEAFEKEADRMIYTVWIGSLVAFLIFVVHNLVALYTWWYEDYKFAVFASYLALIAGGFWYYKRSINKHQKKHEEYQHLYTTTKAAIEEGLKSGCFKEEDIYI